MALDSSSTRAAPTASTSYIAASCNRASNVADCRLEDGLVAFGSGHFVALWNSSDENSRGIHATLPGHQGDVTVLKFVARTAGSSVFVSGDSVGVARVWKEEGGKWSTYAVLTGHSQSISALAALELPGEGEERDFLVLTGGSDGSIQCWRISAAGSELVQKIELKGKLPLELALSYLPASESLVLAVGSTENRIQVFSSPTAGGTISFSKSLTLDGHTDWVRSLAFVTPIPLSTTSFSPVDYDIQPGEVVLASGSQDNYIRLWRFSRLSSQSAPTPTPSGLDALDDLERTLAEAGDGELRVKAHDFTVAHDGEFSCSSEAVLLGHDAWVTGLHWASPSFSSTSPLRLLSSSADRSMILWTPSSDEGSSSIWTSARRFGEFSSATNLGFFGALWGQGARGVMAHGWGGSWHVWRQEVEEEEGEWEAMVAVGGHFGGAKSLAWEPKGEYLISAGSDMATRLHAPWIREVETSTGSSAIETWHELGRPQIHGYPIASVAFTDRLQFISGSDEKIVRIFDAPKVFLTSLKMLCGIEGLGDEESRPIAANVPPLGLSNRAIATSAEEDQLVPESNDSYAAVLPINFTVASHPPFEEQLLGSTLWPEIEKLYGHGYEIIALAAAHTLPLIATACKATTAEHAVIRLYDSKTWKPVGSILEGHSLTITSLRFSADDRWLLSVSRDRSWHLFENVGGEFRPAANLKAHARIIWDGCWAADDSFFVTASRDKTAKVWHLQDGKWAAAATLKFEEAATAVASTLLSNPARHLLAVGLENGHIHLLTAPLADPTSWTSYLAIDSSIAHVQAVTAMAFRPKAGTLTLASASDDRSVRVIELAS